MVNTNTKEFRDKVQAHIRNYMKGMGGTTALFSDIQYLMKRDKVGAYKAAYEYCLGGGFMVGHANALAILKRWGLTDEKKIWKYGNKTVGYGPEILYWHLISREVARMYEDSLKPRKKVAKKRVTTAVPMTFGAMTQTKTVRRK